MSRSRTAKVLSESESPVWDQLVKRSPQGTFFDSELWLRLVSAGMGGEFRLIVCFEQECAIGGCAFYTPRTSPRKTVSPPPLTQYQGILLTSEAEADRRQQKERRNASIIDCIADVAEREFSSVQLIHHPALRDIRPLLWRGWRASPRYTYVLNLRSPGTIETSFDSAFLNRVSKARQANVRVQKSDDTELFYSICEKGERHSGTKIPVSREFFCKIFSGLSSRGFCTMYVATLKEGTPVAARTVLINGDTAYDLIAGADPQYLDTGAVEMLVYSIVEELSSRVSRYDLCGADTPRIASFKSALGGELVLHFLTEKACSRSARVSDSIVFVGKSFLRKG